MRFKIKLKSHSLSHPRGCKSFYSAFEPSFEVSSSSAGNQFFAKIAKLWFYQTLKSNKMIVCSFHSKEHRKRFVFLPDILRISLYSVINSGFGNDLH